MKFGNITIGKQLFVGWGLPKALGLGEKSIRGAAYVEGPLQVGNDTQYEEVEATVMIGEEDNDDALIDLPDTPQDIRDGVDRKMRPANLSLKVKGNTVIEGDDKTPDALVVDGDVTINNGNMHTSNLLGVTGQGCAWRESTINQQSWKGFDIKHPNKEKHRLRHVCVEGPEAAVYCRGRVCNGNNVIDLPSYWKGLVDYESITVQLTCLGSHQNVIVKRISPIEDKVYLQSQGGMPVDCFYHIMAARIDGEELVVEYEGESSADYPGDSSQFSISGYDYGRGVTNE